MPTRYVRLRRRAKRAAQVLAVAVKRFNEQRALRWAAAISYYTAFALAPMLLVLVAVAGLVLQPAELRAEVADETEAQLGPQVAALIERLMLETTSRRASLIGGLLGFAVALFGASTAVATLQDALQQIFGVTPKPHKALLGTVITRAKAVAAVMALGLLITVALIASTVVLAAAELIGAQLGIGATLVGLANRVLTFVLLVVMIASVFKLLANAPLSWRSSIYAAVVTTVLLQVAQLLIAAYLGERDIPATYGAAASLAVLLVWIYLNATIMLFGASLLYAYRQRVAQPESSG